MRDGGDGYLSPAASRLGLEAEVAGLRAELRATRDALARLERRVQELDERDHETAREVGWLKGWASGVPSAASWAAGTAFIAFVSALAAVSFARAVAG